MSLFLLQLFYIDTRMREADAGMPPA